MFDAIDGRKGSPDLAHAAKVSDRAAQLFVKELLDLGLVRAVPDAAARGVVVARDEDAIVDWYLQRAAGDTK
jgi:predicted transcriptional regulator